MLRQDVAPYLDDTWGFGDNITSEVRQPMAFEEEAWDKPRHRYTWEQVKAMERNEFDHRLDLHSIYGSPGFNVDHIRAKHPDPRHPVRVVLRDTLRNDDIDWDEYVEDDPVVAMTESGYRPRHDLRRDHVERGVSPADANMGDTFTPEEQEEWVRRTAERPQHPSLRWSDAEEVYGHFHMRQYERLLDLGKRRQAEANQFMSELKKREALRHAYDAKGRSADLLLGDSGTKPMDQDGSGTGQGSDISQHGGMQPGGELVQALQAVQDELVRDEALRDRIAKHTRLSNPQIMRTVRPEEALQQRDSFLAERGGMGSLQAGDDSDPDGDRLILEEFKRRNFVPADADGNNPAHWGHTIAGDEDNGNLESHPHPYGRLQTNQYEAANRTYLRYHDRAIRRLEQALTGPPASTPPPRGRRVPIQRTITRPPRGRGREQGGTGPPMQVAQMLSFGLSQSGGGATIDHRGQSAEQQVIAGSGRPGAPPGWHYMSTGVMMRDAD
jgi:hypothetical protein